jgi:hypothetical protein
MGDERPARLFFLYRADTSFLVKKIMLSLFSSAAQELLLFVSGKSRLFLKLKRLAF